MSSRAAGTSRLTIQPGTLLQSGWLTRDDKDTVEDYYFFSADLAFTNRDSPAPAPQPAWQWGSPCLSHRLEVGPAPGGQGAAMAGLGLGLELGGAKLERQGWGGREGGREAEREAGKEVGRETGRQGGREGDALGGAPVPLRPAGGSQLAQPRSPVSQSPFQPLCGLLTGGGWSYIKAHYENYNIRPRACPRRQLGSFQALSPRSAGPSCKISI